MLFKNGMQFLFQIKKGQLEWFMYWSIVWSLLSSPELILFLMLVSFYRLQENRYEMYVKLLKDGVKELLTAKENDAALKKSQSSPHLNQESQPAAAKIKRNTSERKDYRPETPKVT